MLNKGHAYDLYQLAKHCAWNPQTLDFRQDVQDWAALNPREQDILCRLLSMFVAGEEAVASDLAPLLWAIGRAGACARHHPRGARTLRRRRAVRH
jgi:ribonucleotide reductase beta subunit family protein with ferritin-like domain